LPGQRLPGKEGEEEKKNAEPVPYALSFVFPPVALQRRERREKKKRNPVLSFLRDNHHVRGEEEKSLFSPFSIEAGRKKEGEGKKEKLRQTTNLMIPCDWKRAISGSILRRARRGENTKLLF